MKRLSIALVVLLGFGVSVCASGRNLAWDLPTGAAADVPTAQALVYTAYVDGAVQGQVLSGVTCSLSGTTITCQTPFPFVINGTPLTNGNHNFALTLAAASGPESPQSTVATFQVEVNGPGNVRVK